MRFPFNEEKALAAVLFIIQQYGGKINKHKLAKILYFADKKHLVRYMRPILGDRYIAMSFGPVPSGVSDGIKGNKYQQSFQDALTTEGSKYILSSKEPNLRVLSKTDIECLTESFEENKRLSFNALTRKSHSYAWEQAMVNGPMSILDMAKEDGASNDALEYIEDLMSDYCLSDF